MNWCDVNPSTSRRAPENFINSLGSRGLITVPNCNGETDDWVVCKFDVNCEHLLYMGGNNGSFSILDVRTACEDPSCDIEGSILSSFVAHKGVVMDINGVPGSRGQVLTVSGDANIRLWDVNFKEPKATLFAGHDATVRSASFAPNCSNVFVSGGRDGQIRVWDTRIKSMHKEKRSGLMYTHSVKAFSNSHIMKDSTPTRKGVRRKDPPKVVSVLYLNDYEVVSGSDCASSGLRVWDTRKMPVNDEGHLLRTLNIPIPMKSRRDVGVSNLVLDRHGSSLFAAITNNIIYEYAATTINTEPIRALKGAAIGSYDIMMCASPVSDHILAGSTEENALLWNLQDFYGSNCERFARSAAIEVQPSHSFGRHSSSVTSVSWSSSGTHLVTMDENNLRIWTNRNREYSSEINGFEEEFPDYEAVEIFERPLTRSFTSPRKGYSNPYKLRQLWGSANSSTKKTPVKTPSKTPVKTPVKTPTKTPLKTPNKTPTKSPKAKRMKQSSPNSALLEITNQDVVTPQCRRFPRRKRNVFYAKYPTENLPNYVYEKFLRDLRGTTEDSSFANTPTTSCRKRLDDYWERTPLDTIKKSNIRAKRSRVPSSSEFRESVCSKMMAEEIRIAHNSPKKLVLRKSPQKRLVPVAKTDIRSPTGIRKLNRNLLDYFTKSK